tara:strand:- start:669 stop:842 length:174 start_codon:yes stop_codon:yes gene_type:complete
MINGYNILKFFGILIGYNSLLSLVALYKLIKYFNQNNEDFNDSTTNNSTMDNSIIND